MALNWDKFKSAIHYVCYKADDPSVLGAIKLNKVLWYSDAIGARQATCRLIYAAIG